MTGPDLTIGSLCSGYGGLDLAVETVTGARTAWFCEFDKAPSRILHHHWPNVPNHRDMTQVDWSAVEPVDIITGGTPCQDLSSAGKRAGMTEGTRSNLWVQMREAIRIIRPRLVVWENVRGALSATAASDSDMEPEAGLLGDGPGNNLRALGRVVGDLATLGYDARWEVVRASDVGAPHHRARVFLIAHPADTDRLRMETGGQPIPGASALPVTDDGERAFPGALTHLPTPRSADSQGGAWEGESRTGGPDLRTAITHLPTPRASDPANATSHSSEGFRPQLGETVRGDFGQYAPVVARWEQATGTTAPAPTEPNTTGKPRLSAAFAEWMMGLPAGWITSPEIGLTRAQQLKAIGNGVVPQQATAAITHLLTTTERTAA